jgi:Tol biopolymer transport system component
MPETAERVRELAAAVADGAVVDWSHEAAVAFSHDQREQLAALQLLARIAEVHGSAAWADRSIGPDAGTPAADGASVGLDRTWGPLRLIELIGHGTFGEVYRAWDPRLEREVALKLLCGHATRSAAAAALDAVVVHEARLMARVRHPGVATIYGADHFDDRTGLWMELVGGHTLEDELARNGPLPADAVRRCGIAMADALAAVHRAGLLHRDVKTQNVMRDADGRLVLTDFGTGLDFEAAGEPGPLAGTPLYLAPELLEGAAPTPRSDLYSLGVVLFRLATGDYPAPGRTLNEVRSAHARGLRRTLAQARPSLPPDLVCVIDRALAVDPRDRFADAPAMREALGATRGHLAAPSGRRRAAVLAVAIVAAGSWFASERLRDRREMAGPAAAGLAALLPSTGLREVSPDPDVEDDGAPSPDGRFVSYVDENTGRLATYEVATRVRTFLIGGPGSPADGRAASSRFSLDGREVAYVWRQGNGRPDEVYAVASTGGPSRRLWQAPPGHRLYLHAWSSDRDEIVLVQTGARQVSTLVLAGTRSGSSRALRTLGRRPPLFVSRSPDGRWLVFDVTSPDTGLRDVHALDLVTGLERVVVDGPASDHSPTWTPDGSRLVFLSNRTGTIGVWTVPVTGGRATDRPVELEANVGESGMMGLVRNGALYLSRQVRLRNVHVAAFDSAARTLVGNPRPVSARSGWNGASDWSPDGRLLTFFRRDHARYRLIVKDVATGSERELGDEGVDGIQRPRWTRDGRSILYWTEYEGENGLFRIDISSGATTPMLVDPRFTGFEPIPGTDRLVYHLGAREFRIRSLATGEDTALAAIEAPYSIYGTAVSRDGGSLAYTVRAPRQPHRLHLLDLETGNERRDVLVGAPGERLAVWEWTPEGDAVYLVRARDLRDAPREPFPSDESRLYWVDIATGEPHLVGLNVHNLRALRLSPDGRQMAMDIGNPLSTVWMLEHFLPSR